MIFHVPMAPSKIEVCRCLCARFFLMTTTAFRLSFHPSPHSLARGACPRRQPLSNSHLTFPTPTPTHSSTLIPFHRSHRRRQSPITMSDSGRSSSPAAQPPPKELNEESDFETILSPDGYISICGFGSLLSGTYKFNHLHHHRRRFDVLVVVRWLVNWCGVFGRQREARGVHFRTWSTSELRGWTGFVECMLTWLPFSSSAALPSLKPRSIKETERKIYEMFMLLLFAYSSTIQKYQFLCLVRLQVWENNLLCKF